jgi:putative oxygen-independent coproporphyrinogen III oxidase
VTAVQSAQPVPAELPLGLYVHFPWCVRKCPYCDFNSHEYKEPIPERAYLDVLIRDLAAAVADTGRQRAPLASIFFGGGTPSLISPGVIHRVIEAADTHFRFDDDIEITLEANPGTVQADKSVFVSDSDQGRLADYRSAGVNRLSLGIQSFADAFLARLGRIHSGNDAMSAFTAARQAGFENINLDLMHGLPGQQWAEAESDLRTAIDLAPEHISWYQLTLERNTVFYRFPPSLPDEDAMALIYDQGIQTLSNAGYARYEISAFSTEGRQCRHNLNYWQFGDYMGIGAGAHGKFSNDNSIVRTFTTRVPGDYLRDPGRTLAPVGLDELPTEYMMNALRLIDGTTVENFEQRTGLSRQVLAPFLSRAQNQGLVATGSREIKLTSTGLNFLDSVLLLLD